MSVLPADVRRGARDTAPILLMVLPYGLIVGATAVASGFSAGQAVVFSAVVNAGAAQLAAMDLLSSGSPPTVAVATALVINLRLVMYGASLGPYFRRTSVPWRAALAHLIVDPTYAIGVLTFEGDESVDRRWYFLGLGLPLLVAWIAGTAAGAVVGARLPPWLPLSFAIPMVFLALLVQAVEGRATAAAALVGAGLAVAGVGLPFNLGLVVGAVAGVGAGLLVEWRTDP